MTDRIDNESNDYSNDSDNHYIDNDIADHVYNDGDNDQINNKNVNDINIHNKDNKHNSSMVASDIICVI